MINPVSWIFPSHQNKLLLDIRKTIEKYLLQEGVQNHLIRFRKEDNVLKLLLPDGSGCFVVQVYFENGVRVIYNSFLLKNSGERFSLEYKYEELNVAMKNFLKYFKYPDSKFYACVNGINDRLDTIIIHTLTPKKNNHCDTI